MAKLEIKGDSRTMFGMSFILDGHKLRHLESLELSMDIEGTNEATIRFLVDEMVVDADVLLRLQGLIVEDDG